jgi:ferredoxin-NADP reductase
MNAPDLSSLAAPTTTRNMRVRTIRYEAQNVHSFELVDPDGEALPAFEAGAHVDVHVFGQVRSYSLAGDPNDSHRWWLGVLKETQGTGGSKAMHEQVRVGAILKVGAVRNAFLLDRQAQHTILLAGGIGITPLKAMAHTLSRSGSSFELHYCARSPLHAAFLEELKAIVPVESLHLHFDHGDPAQGLDISGLLKQSNQNTHVYFCGPAGFMAACKQATSHWPADQVHSEHFKAPEPEKLHTESDGSFEVHLARSGETIRVEPNQTIVRAIELTGRRVPTSCLSGLCGSCKVTYLDGEVDHRDYILSDEEKNHCLTVCVSRAKSKSLSLDL